MKLLLVTIFSTFSAVHKAIGAPSPACNNNSPDPNQLLRDYFSQNEHGSNESPSSLPMMVPVMLLMPYPFYKFPRHETVEEHPNTLQPSQPSTPATSIMPLKRRKGHKLTQLDHENPETFAPSSTQLGAAIMDALSSLKGSGTLEDGKHSDSPDSDDITSRLFSPNDSEEGSEDDENDEYSDRRSMLFSPLAKFASRAVKGFAGALFGDYDDESGISKYERQRELENAYKLGASEGQLQAIKNAKSERELELLRKDLDNERERNRDKESSYREGKLEGKLDGQSRNGHMDIHSKRQKRPSLKDNDEERRIEKNYKDEGSYKDGSNKYSNLKEMMQNGNESEDGPPTENSEPFNKKKSKPSNQPESQPSSSNPEGRKRGGAAGSASAGDVSVSVGADDEE